MTFTDWLENRDNQYYNEWFGQQTLKKAGSWMAKKAAPAFVAGTMALGAGTANAPTTQGPTDDQNFQAMLDKSDDRADQYDLEDEFGNPLQGYELKMAKRMVDRKRQARGVMGGVEGEVERRVLSRQARDDQPDIANDFEDRGDEKTAGFIRGLRTDDLLNKMNKRK